MRRETENVIRAKNRVLKGEKVVDAAKAENASASAVYKALYRDGLKIKKGVINAVVT